MLVTIFKVWFDFKNAFFVLFSIWYFSPKGRLAENDCLMPYSPPYVDTR